MKLITAIISESKLDMVREALIESEITRITVSRASGFGRQVREEIYRGKKIVPNLNPKVRIDIAVNDEFVNITVDAIIKSARSQGDGEIGDGKIWIQHLEEVIRIRTGERGRDAI